ncbi:MAG: protein kinase [Deltaproteobacteria bacterium]|jgi:serine/threonine protein kinase|nr:protein kinase [Deltaproteobacteria bacterium]
MTKGTFGADSLGTAYCPKCHTGYRLSSENLGHRSICVKCGQYFHLLPESEAADTLWEDTTVALNELASRVWERGLDLRVGQVVLGVYVVQEILGRGGLGQVFKVRHRDWQKELALKLPYRSVMETRYFQSLKNEAETWVAMGLHPNVVTCYYARPLMGVPSIFMEYVAGGSLSELAQKRPSGELPPLFQGDELTRTLRFLDLSIQAAWGLEHAHSRGVLHLDIKPQNLLLEEDTGRLLVTDFGLARAARETENPSDSASLWPGDIRSAGEAASPSYSEPGQGAFGTPQYMSPEAIDKQPPTPGFDLWSLTLTILELFLGGRPWEYGGTVGAVLEQYVGIGKSLTPLPVKLYALIRKSLAPNPADRYPSAASVVADLIAIYEEIAGREYPRAKPVLAPDSADNLNNRAVSMLDLGRPDEAERLWKQALKAEPDHQTSFFNLALHRYRSRAIGAEAFQGRLDDLVRFSSAKMNPDLPLIMCGAYLELGLVSEAAGALESYDGPTLNHEAKRLADILERGRRNPEHVERMRPAIYRISKIRDREPDGAETQKLVSPILAAAKKALEDKNYPKALELLQDVRRYPEAVGAPDFTESWRALYNICVRAELKDIVDAKTPSASLKGDSAAYCQGLLLLSNQRQLTFIKNFLSPAPSYLETKLANPPVALAISNGGHIAATLTQDGHLWLFNPENGSGLGQALAHGSTARCLAFGRDDRRLYTAGDDGELKMWDMGHGYLDKGTPLLVRKLSDRALCGLAVSPNGRVIQVLDGEREYRLNAEKMGGPVKSFPLSLAGKAPYHLTSLAADPFNRYLLSAWEEGSFFHQLFDTDWKPDLSNLEGVVTALAVSPDARLWAAAQNGGRLFLGFAPQENRLTFLPIKSLETGVIHFLRFTSDNSHLLAVGQNGLSLYYLDWNLELPQSQGWDKKAEMILHNFMARRHDVQYSDSLALALKKDLATAGMPQMDGNIIINRLKDAIANAY